MEIFYDNRMVKGGSENHGEKWKEDLGGLRGFHEDTISIFKRILLRWKVKNLEEEIFLEKL